MPPDIQFITGDAFSELLEMPDESVQMCCTSPPYWSKRDYCHADQIGLEKTPELFIARLCCVFREVRRVLRKDGTLWIVIGDTRISKKGEAQRDAVRDQNSLQATHTTGHIVNAPSRTGLHGYKEKDMAGIPFMLAFALRDGGWYWRQINVWHKPNSFTESVKDRTGDSHEYILHFSKSKNYYYDSEAVKEPASPLTVERLKHGWNRAGGRDYKGFPGAQDRNQAQINRELAKKSTNGDMRVNKRSVWTVGTIGYEGEHFATYPPDLIKPCILAGSPVGGVVLDPFAGTFTTCATAIELGRSGIGIEINPDYVELGRQRCAKVTPGLPLVTV
jgi:DNA modification methylase